MSDEQSILGELAEVKAQRDRLGSLVGTAYNDDGSVIPALEAAAAQEDVAAMREQVQAVVSFLRENNPNR